MSGLRIKRLWPDIEGCGCGCDCCDSPEPQQFMVLSHDGVDYWTTRLSPALMLRADLLDAGDRADAVLDQPEVPPTIKAWVDAGTPDPAPARGRFQRVWVEALTEAGLTFRPTSDAPFTRHAVCRGEEVVGWIMPGRYDRIDGYRVAEDWVEVPAP